MKPERVALANLGCKANQYDGTYMSSLLQAKNFQLVDFKEEADIYIINTCTVTDHADADSRNLIRRAHRRNPDSIKVVTGCYAQTRPQDIAEMENVNLILGNNKKAHLLDYLEQARQERDKLHIEVDEDIFAHRSLDTFGMSHFTHQTRAYVKIQDGCNQFCSFCIIPFARGRNRSVPMYQVIEELAMLSEHGYHEAILTGIHIGTYGHDFSSSSNLLALLKLIEKERPIHRVRISSIDPEEITDEMIEFLSSSEIFCPHLHIPLQSGDDSTLKLMRRRYTRNDFEKLCQKLFESIPRLCIGTDVMVGFPYEDNLRHRNTVALLENCPIAYFHVFPYSSKKGTRAAQMLGQVDAQLKKNRASELRELSVNKMKFFHRQFIGQTAELIFERLTDVGLKGKFWAGHTENYLPVLMKDVDGAVGKLLKCKIQYQIGEELFGEVE